MLDIVPMSIVGCVITPACETAKPVKVISEHERATDTFAGCVIVSVLLTVSPLFENLTSSESTTTLSGTTKLEVIDLGVSVTTGANDVGVTVTVPKSAPL